MDELDPASVQTSLQLRGLSWMVPATTPADNGEAT